MSLPMTSILGTGERRCERITVTQARTKCTPDGHCGTHAAPNRGVSCRERLAERPIREPLVRYGGMRSSAAPETRLEEGEGRPEEGVKRPQESVKRADRWA